MVVHVQVPGKLFIAGEYAVVEAGYPAIIVAVDQFLNITLSPTTEHGFLHSTQFEEPLIWQRHRHHQRISVLNRSHTPYRLVLSAMQVAEDYIQAVDNNVLLTYYDIRIDSQLDDAQSGKKYGLGSSGAVTVATIQAILQYFQISATPLLLYKLAVIAQLRISMTGSFGDIAASAFGGWIAYHSVDKQWLHSILERQTLLETVHSTWKDLSVESLEIPSKLEFLVGWTQSTALTADYVSTVSDKKSLNSDFYKTFLVKSKDCVEQLIHACRHNQREQFLQMIQENRMLLNDFANRMDIQIETPELATLCHLAIQQGGVAKSSGAGGGDCGIAFATSYEQAQRIQEAWEQASIQRLPLNPTQPIPKGGQYDASQ